MKRFWGSVLFLALAAVPLLSYAAGLVPCGGHDEPACQTCYLVQLINGVITWIVMILGTVAAIIVVYAGFKLVTSGGNRHAKEEAKSLISNMVIGYVIVLAGWLLIDTGMKMLLIDGETKLGMWNQLSCRVQPGATTGVVTRTGEIDVNVEAVGTYIPINSSLSNTQGWTYTSGGGGGGGGGDSGQAGNAGAYTAVCTRLPGPASENLFSCATQQAQCTAAGGRPVVNAAGNSVTCMPQQVTGGNLPQCTNSYCSVSRLMSAGMTRSQANVMSCIAMTESTGNPNARSRTSTACGLFQILAGTWNSYNSGGSCTSHAASCTNAACNIATAVNIVRRNGYNDWTCPNCNEKAILCIRRYSGS